MGDPQLTFHRGNQSKRWRNRTNGADQGSRAGTQSQLRFHCCPSTFRGNVYPGVNTLESPSSISIMSFSLTPASVHKSVSRAACGVDGVLEALQKGEQVYLNMKVALTL